MDLTQASYMYRLTFLKLGLTSASFGGCVLNSFESQDSQILAF